MKKQDKTYTSKEAKEKLKVSDCHLKHLREVGEITATKKGNAFLYDSDIVDKLSKKKG